MNIWNILAGIASIAGMVFGAIGMEKDREIMLKELKDELKEESK